MRAHEYPQNTMPMTLLAGRDCGCYFRTKPNDRWCGRGTLRRILGRWGGLLGQVPAGHGQVYTHRLPAADTDLAGRLDQVLN